MVALVVVVAFVIMLAIVLVIVLIVVLVTGRLALLAAVEQADLQATCVASVGLYVAMWW